MSGKSRSSKASRSAAAREPQPPAKPPAKPKTGKDFGEEGTNKTQPMPTPNGAAPEELGVTPYIEKSPYIRG